MEFREKLKEDLAIFRQRLIWLEDGTMRSYEYSRGQQMDRVTDAVNYTKRIIAEIEKCLAEHSERSG
ncbi:hypothetical protein [Chenggangzhangella methanolivorans]|uniref:Uncharacterized protein n=1 Tax=Chenggangzhangella methanolivorans TaxID=1437009 RepID=A0A9E6UMU1_9HYPH|nr:hypothetical protein [Chenggangzhangella methanolivorans]QZO02087.1 hypothetical protein K6K41_12920 [Chenggangzhangella methanolivorans]